MIKFFFISDLSGSNSKSYFLLLRAEEIRPVTMPVR